MKTVRFLVHLFITYILTNRLYFVLGLVLSVLLIIFPIQFSSVFNQHRARTIGISGNYTVSSLPVEVQNLISIGLTRLLPDNTATGAAAISWEATDSGKRVTFLLQNNLKWQDGTAFNSSQVNYNLKSVELAKDDPTHISFLFKEPFAPLPTILSQPLFKSGLVGLGNYAVQGLKFNGRFLSQIELKNSKTNDTIVYKFYPRETDLVTALKLGAVNEIHKLHQLSDISQDNHYQVTSATQSATVVTLFFNTQKPPFEEKQLRQALAYALPDNYQDSEKAYAPVPKDSWFESPNIKKYHQDFDTSKKILDKIASQTGTIKITIQTNKSLETIALQIKDSWANVGIESKVEITDVVPESYDLYLAYLELPPDPDQYALWHSTQTGNISHYKSPKIDKLLEEGRRTLNIQDRFDIYSNFEKAITEDLPAVFLYYPQIYTIKKAP